MRVRNQILKRVIFCFLFTGTNTIYRLVSMKVPLELDYKDYFLVRPQTGSRSMKVPTNEELDYFEKRYTSGGNKVQYSGMIMVCLVPCFFGKCKDDEFRFLDKQNDDERITMTVDGEKVHQVSKVSNDCFFLEKDNTNDDVLLWGSGPKENGQHDISFELKGDPKPLLRISSIIVW